MRKVCCETKNITKNVEISGKTIPIIQPVLFRCMYRDICRYYKEPDPSGYSKTIKFLECKTFLKYCKKYGEEAEPKMPDFKIEVVK